MTITFDIPEIVEATLREALGPDLGAAAFEAMLVEGYRAGKLSTGDIALALGYGSRLQAEQWLAQRGAALNYSLADLDADRSTLDRILGPVAR